MKTLVLVSMFICSVCSGTTIVITTNSTSLPLQSSQLFAGQGGYIPVDGSVQTLNPPLFRWVYTGDNPYAVSSDLSPRIFQFQITTNGAYSSPWSDVTCSNNVYNTLKPITNSDGTSWFGTVNWRVIYWNSNKTVRLFTNSQSFMFSPTATNWDRSMLADSNYLYTIFSPHPHVLFTDANKQSVANYYRNVYIGRQNWTSTSNDAMTTIGQAWWGDSVAFTNTGQQTVVNRAAEFLAVSLMYQLDTNATVIAANPLQMVTNFDNYYIVNGLDRQGAYLTGNSQIAYWAIAVDNFKPLMSTLQWSNHAYAVEQTLKYYVYEDWYFEGSPIDTTRVYSWNTRLIDDGGAGKRGNSHPRFDYGTGLVLCESILGDSLVAQSLWPYFINYNIALKDSGYRDEGRGYNDTEMLSTRNLGMEIILSYGLPDAQLWRSTVYTNFTSFYSYYEPVFYNGLLEPWGDLSYGIGANDTMTYNSCWLFLDLGMMTGNGSMVRQFNRQNPTKFTDGGAFSIPVDVFSGYYYSNTPTEVDWSSKDYLNTDDGYMVSGSLQPNDYASFTNGVGFIAQARPDMNVNHNNYPDGQIQIWAYGAQITAGGVGNRAHHSMFHSGSVLVNGIGQWMPISGVVESNYSRFTAFTNSTDFVLASSDTTKSYNRSNMLGWTDPTDFQNPFYTTNKVSYLSSMIRTVAFPHRKYFVLYDTMTSTTNTHFQWVWHYMETNGVVNTNECSFTYTCTNFFNGSNVTIYVVPFIDPATMTLTNMAGTNNFFKNPFTGENYTNEIATLAAATPSESEPAPNGNIWVYNSTPSKTNHFGWVVYPAKWGQPAPTITRNSDTSVTVNDGVNNDTISVDNATGTWTLDFSGVTSTFRPAPFR